MLTLDMNSKLGFVFALWHTLGEPCNFFYFDSSLNIIIFDIVNSLVGNCYFTGLLRTSEKRKLREFFDVAKIERSFYKQFLLKIFYTNFSYCLVTTVSWQQRGKG